MLTADLTPEKYNLPITGRCERIKRLIRRFIYPLYNGINHYRLANRFSIQEFRPDLWLWGQRGNDYQRHRRRVANFFPPYDKDILIAGCGTGQDLESWMQFRPRSVQGIDLFSYQSAWQLWEKHFVQVYPEVLVSFHQGNLEYLGEFSDSSIDIIGSDAVFEHIKNFSVVLSEFHRILRPGGILYATFGPLWYSWGGDHVSGYDNVLSGYNHLLLDKVSYDRYIDGLGIYNHSEHDGRTWLKNDLFSRLTPIQYIQSLEIAGFQPLFIGASINPHSITCLKYPNLANRLNHFDRISLIVSGMTIICTQK